MGSDTGSRLKSWRLQQGLHQSTCAEQAGMSQSAWSLIEAGRQRPGVDQALAIDALTRGVIGVRDWAMNLPVLRRLARAALPPRDIPAE